MPEIILFAIDESVAGQRLDKALSLLWDKHSRSEIGKLIDEEKVTVNGNVVKSAYKVQKEDNIAITYEPPSVTMEKEDIPLDIVYEDADVIVINKPVGMVVHPAPGHRQGTLANALLGHSASLSDINGPFRPGIVHRLDKDTSGILIVAKNNYAHAFLARQLQARTVVREYVALVEGVIRENKGIIDAPIGRDEKFRQRMAVNIANGKPAITHFEVIKRYGSHTLVKCHLKTGRTHQIRVHMAYIRHPVAGDILYGGKTHFYNQGQWLHCQSLTFTHPTDGQKRTFSVPLPERLTKILDNKNL